MVRDAYYLLLPLIATSIICLVAGWIFPAIALLTAATFVAFFFRNPDRDIPADPATLVSPADGKVIRVEPSPGGIQISIFLSIFNVHVNRAPVAGKITRLTHKPGRFHLAYDDRASVENEQVVFSIGEQRPITFALIAGLVARRIVPWKKEGETVEKGDRIALIRFGSRVDIIIPPGFDVRVRRGDRVLGGTTILAYWGENS